MRDLTLNFRTTKSDRALFDRAAVVSGKKRTEFMLDAAREKAVQVLLDQTLFVVDEDKFSDLQKLLEAPLPAAQMEALRSLRRRPVPWDPERASAKRVASR